MPHRSANDLGALNPPPRLVDRFRRDLATLIDAERDRVVVAVSGGADSIALLLLMRAALGHRCSAATVDHGLRAASADEAAFVASLCAARGIPHEILRAPLPARAGGSTNVSSRARMLRYRLLEDQAARLDGAWLATAHHADDQVETMVMRLNRGSGIAGLAGIRRKGRGIIRPLLGWRRAELTAIVEECGIAAVHDPSNVDDRFDRARLRKVLADVDWLDADRIGASAKALGDAEDALAWAARAEWSRRCAADGTGLSLNVAGLPFELRRRLALLCLERLQPDIDPPGPALVRFLDALESGDPSMLGSVIASADPITDVWRFRPAPPRRTH